MYSCCIRYANDVQTGDHVLVLKGNELVPEEVIAVTPSKMLGKILCDIALDTIKFSVIFLSQKLLRYFSVVFY